MRLIEKKCPNCGANLEFNEFDKTCKCEYCKREFEIERDEKGDSNNINEQYHLSEAGKTLAKVVGISFIVQSMFVFIPIFMAIIIAVAVIPRAIYTQDILPNKLISNIDKVSDDILNEIKEKSERIAYQTAHGQNDLKYSYMKSDSLRLQKMYFAYKDDSNYIIFIYQTKYHNYWNQTSEQTVYIPVVFKNIKNNLSNLNNGKNPAPEYYFNEEKTTYIYAYSSFEDVYNEVVKPLERDYKIIEK